MFWSGIGKSPLLFVNKGKIEIIHNPLEDLKS